MTQRAVTSATVISLAAWRKAHATVPVPVPAPVEVTFTVSIPVLMLWWPFFQIVTVTP
jgi:hypothetical protein